MSEQGGSTVEGLAPWRSGAPWWLVLLEGLIALAVGIFILAQPARIGQWLVYLIAGYLVITSALDIYAGLGGSAAETGRTYRLLGGGIGFIAGLLVLVVPLITSTTLPSMLAILGIGLIGRGIVTLVGGFLSREETGGRWVGILPGVLNVALGALLLLLLSTDAVADVLRWLGILAVIGGGALVVFAFMLARRPPAAAWGARGNRHRASYARPTTMPIMPFLLSEPDLCVLPPVHPRGRRALCPLRLPGLAPSLQ